LGQIKSQIELRSAAFRSSDQPLKELLNVSHVGIKVSHAICKISHATSKISHATSKVIQLCLHAIDAAFYRSESLLSRRGFTINILWCQAANEMMYFCVLPGTSHEIGDTGCIACVAYVEVI
jgi:hypothetical protein